MRGVVHGGGSDGVGLCGVRDGSSGDDGGGADALGVGGSRDGVSELGAGAAETAAATAGERGSSGDGAAGVGALALPSLLQGLSQQASSAATQPRPLRPQSLRLLLLLQDLRAEGEPPDPPETRPRGSRLQLIPLPALRQTLLTKVQPRSPSRSLARSTERRRASQLRTRFQSKSDFFPASSAQFVASSRHHLRVFPLSALSSCAKSVILLSAFCQCVVIPLTVPIALFSSPYVLSFSEHPGTKRSARCV